VDWLARIYLDKRNGGRLLRPLPGKEKGDGRPGADIARTDIRKKKASLIYRSGKQGGEACIPSREGREKGNRRQVLANPARQKENTCSERSEEGRNGRDLKKKEKGLFSADARKGWSRIDGGDGMPAPNVPRQRGGGKKGKAKPPRPVVNR